MPRNPIYFTQEELRLDAARRQREYRQRQHDTNPDYYKQRNRAAYGKAPEKFKAKALRRRRHIYQRTPPWSEREAIELFYENRPPGHHVDHIIPLRGEHVSGLHVLANLQYLPAIDNIRKSNNPQAGRDQPAINLGASNGHKAEK